MNSKVVKRDKDDNYVMLKESIQQEEVKILGIDAPNIRVLKYMKQVRVGDFNILSTAVDR